MRIRSPLWRMVPALLLRGSVMAQRLTATAAKPPPPFLLAGFPLLIAVPALPPVAKPPLFLPPGFLALAFPFLMAPPFLPPPPPANWPTALRLYVLAIIPL